jgi:outer membrane lipoprotein SlyB
MRFNMNATLTTPSQASGLSAPSTKPLWAAVGVLSVCVLAMGATLVHVNKRPEPLAQASIPLSSAMAMNAPASLSTSAGMITEEKIVDKPAVAAAKHAQTAPKVVAKPATQTVAKAPASMSNTAPKSAPSTAPIVVAQAPVPANVEPAPAVVQVPAKPVCLSCGTVEAVTPIAREGQGSGVGVIAGGVLGGVVGNQVGKGSGRAVATVLGAVGGGLAGNTIEKKIKKETAYSVRVRMEDGTSRTIEQSSAPIVGSKVTLDGNTMRPA